jgi:hypothetical protein
LFGVSTARAFLAAPDVDVRNLAILDERGELFLGDAKALRCLGMGKQCEL